MDELVTDDRKLFFLEDDWQPLVMFEDLDLERIQNVNFENMVYVQGIGGNVWKSG